MLVDLNRQRQPEEHNSRHQMIWMPGMRPLDW
jgi:hypothetical protein